MTEARPVPPASVPTLTEVVDAPEGVAASAAAPAATPTAAYEPVVVEPTAPAAATPSESLAASVPAGAAPVAPAAAAVVPSESQLVERILEDLQHQVDLVVEYRIRERLTPILERAGDVLVREARAELSRSLREVVARAVASELRRQRGT
jgi:hypothetical protein